MICIAYTAICDPRQRTNLSQLFSTPDASFHFKHALVQFAVVGRAHAAAFFENVQCMRC